MEWFGRYREAFMAPRKYSCDKWEHYFDIYDELLGRYYGKPGTNYLEIGIQNGGSLEIMRSLLGPDVTINGLDIDPRCAEIVHGRGRPGGNRSRRRRGLRWPAHRGRCHCLRVEVAR